VAQLRQGRSIIHDGGKRGTGESSGREKERDPERPRRQERIKPAARIWRGRGTGQANGGRNLLRRHAGRKQWRSRVLNRRWHKRKRPGNGKEGRPRVLVGCSGRAVYWENSEGSYGAWRRYRGEPGAKWGRVSVVISGATDVTTGERIGGGKWV